MSVLNMNKKFYFIIVLLVIFKTLPGCSVLGIYEPEKKKLSIEDKPPARVETEEIQTPLGLLDIWTFKENAIELHIIPSKDLNEFQDREHTLFLMIFQMSDPNGFNSLCSTTEGLQSLLSREVAESSIGILSSNKFIISPGKEKIIKIDRAKSAQNLGFVAAYFNLLPEKVYKIINIPIVQDKKKGVDKINPLKKATPAKHAIMKMWMELDKNKIKDITIITE